jgi:hypothetical protein
LPSGFLERYIPLRGEKMKRFHIILTTTIFLAAPVLNATGCAHAGETGTLTPQQVKVKNAERALLITRVLIEEAHKAVWSDPLRLRVSKCEGSSDVPLCMGDFTPENNQRVIQALEAYSASAKVAAGAILAASKDSSGPDPFALTKNAVDAGLSFLAIIPRASSYSTKLTELLEGIL